MYISEFFCGVGATIISEVILLIMYALYDSKKKKQGGKTWKEK